ncbi:hypothetical protein DIS24_g11848 [Lasiodiplodia hormozganensis]|uniref:Uncharacterized protein n=1 Tax=Lasiodiplodia hormozganensis TaxID=869390 RepID=A0AA39WHG0_9PEZI|nr:hypothetical protein DIS24_g11848 [Lasiodiplodia hormozganensis]
MPPPTEVSRTNTPSPPPLETAYTAALPHNATHSLLHRLPLELLSHLATYHLSSSSSSSSAADILSLRATSNDFRHNPLIPAPFSCPTTTTTTTPSFSFSSSHRAALAAAKDFRQRLARDDTFRAFLAACATERAALHLRPWPALDERPRACGLIRS